MAQTAQTNDYAIGSEYVQALTKEALAEAGGEAKDAATFLEQKCHDRQDIRDAVADNYMSDFCWQAIRLHCQDERRVVWMTGPDGHNRAQKRLARVGEIGVLDMTLPIPGFPRFGDANRLELGKAITSLNARVKGTVKSIALFEAARAKLKNDKAAVSSVLSEKQAVRLRNKIARETP